MTTTCLLVAGVVSGLTVGLAAIDHLQLEIASKQSPEIAKSSKRIFAVID